MKKWLNIKDGSKSDAIPKQNTINNKLTRKAKKKKKKKKERGNGMSNKSRAPYITLLVVDGAPMVFISST